MHKIIKENIWLDSIITIILIILFPIVNDSLSKMSLSESRAGSLLIAMSMISVIACFGNFSFTYEKIDINKVEHRLLAHTVSGLFLMVIGITLIFLDILLAQLVGRLIIIDISLLLLYLASIGYDFWDIMRRNI